MQRAAGPAQGGAAFSSDCWFLSRGGLDGPKPYEEEMRGRERGESEGGCMRVMCDRLSASEGQHMDRESEHEQRGQQIVFNVNIFST